MDEKCSRIGPYFSNCLIIMREWEGGKPNTITGVGSMRFNEEVAGAEMKREVVVSGSGDEGAKLR